MTADRSEPERIATCKRSFGRRVAQSWWKLLLLVLGLVAVAIALT